jgi:hypothetical protein
VREDRVCSKARGGTDAPAGLFLLILRKRVGRPLDTMISSSCPQMLLIILLVATGELARGYEADI